VPLAQITYDDLGLQAVTWQGFHFGRVIGFEDGRRPSDDVPPTAPAEDAPDRRALALGPLFRFLKRHVPFPNLI
jgi:hypothetical protein